MVVLLPSWGKNKCRALPTDIFANEHDETQKYQWNSGKRLWLGRDRNMFGVSLDLNLTPLAAFLRFFAERRKRKKAAIKRGQI